MSIAIFFMKRLHTGFVCAHRVALSAFLLTLLGLQSRVGDNWGQITRNMSGLSPKRDWSSKRVGIRFCVRYGAPQMRTLWDCGC